MTRKQERYCLLVFALILAFMSYRQMERTAWINEIQYAQGADRAKMVHIHHSLGGSFK